MTLKELKEIIDNLPQKYDDHIIVFGVAFSNMELGNVHANGPYIELNI